MPMRALVLVLVLLWLTAFCLAVDLEPRHRALNSQFNRPTDPFSLLLGDSRRLFAKHLYAKADAYFHGGYYPSIYDLAQQRSDPAMDHRVDPKSSERITLELSGFSLSGWKQRHRGSGWSNSSGNGQPKG